MIVWLRPSLSQHQTKNYFPIHHFWYVRTWNECREGSQHDNAIAIKLNTKSVLSMLPWESHPQLVVIDKVFFFVFRSLGSLCASRSFNCHETQNWGQRERWEKASHVHVHPRLKNSSVKLNFIKNSSNWIIRIGGSWFCAWRHSERVIYMFKSFFFLFFSG